jgi:hypothetical protein
MGVFSCEKPFGHAFLPLLLRFGERPLGIETNQLANYEKQLPLKSLSDK